MMSRDCSLVSDLVKAEELLAKNCFLGGHVTSARLNGKRVSFLGRVRVWDRAWVRVCFGYWLWLGFGLGSGFGSDFSEQGPQK